ncbi:dTDP-4-dehydrorhamnose reductase [Paenibacillus lautus]
MKVLVTGSSGQLGQDVVRLLKRTGFKVKGYSKEELDITDLEQCRRIISEYRPECIIHCAAYTAVDLAETNIDKAYLVNAIGTRNIVIASEYIKAKLVYISTDYVFDGQSELPYHEYDNTNPLSIYGKSKRAGEELVQSLGSKWFIVRTSWVFGHFGNNFVKTMLNYGQTRPILQVVNDQKGSPTFTIDIARFLIALIQTEKYGVYHVSNSSFCTWYEFAKAISQEMNNLVENSFTAIIEPCTTESYSRPAPRPRNSVLEHIAIRANGFEDLRPWRDGLKDFLFEYHRDEPINFFP